MIQLKLKQFDDLSHQVKNVKILVVGDIMLDQYYWGSVKRISPEAPVPVVDIRNESIRLGGAGNVITNILGLGAIPIIIGVVGEDHYAGKCFGLLEELKISQQGLITDSTRPTTVKTRIIADNQHIVRADKESVDFISKSIEEKIIWVFEQLIGEVNAVIIQDYNKGLIGESLIKILCGKAHAKNKIITVDPKFGNFFAYKNVTVFKPNHREVEIALNQQLVTNHDIERAGKELMERLAAQNILMTHGAKGMTLIENSGIISRVPTRAKEVADVSGAGDTVISTLTTYMAAGATVPEAATLANYAAGIVCGEVGVIPIQMDQLRDTLEADTA